MKLGMFNLMTLVDNPRGVDGVLADTQSMVLTAERLRQMERVRSA